MLPPYQLARQQWSDIFFAAKAAWVLGCWGAGVLGDGTAGCLQLCWVQVPQAFSTLLIPSPTREPAGFAPKLPT